MILGALPKLLTWEVCTWWRCLTVYQPIKSTYMGDFRSILFIAMTAHG